MFTCACFLYSSIFNKRFDENIILSCLPRKKTFIVRIHWMNQGNVNFENKEVKEEDRQIKKSNSLLCYL